MVLAERPGRAPLTPVLRSTVTSALASPHRWLAAWHVPSWCLEQEPAAESCKMPPVLALLLPACSHVANAWGLSQWCLNRWSLWCEPWREQASTKCCSKSHNGMSYTPVGDSQALHLRWWWLILRVSLLLQRLWQTAHLPPPRSILP